MAECSTKINMAVTIIKYHLCSPDDSDPLSFDSQTGYTGHLEVPGEPLDHSKIISKRKIVVYVEFAMAIPLILSVSRLQLQFDYSQLHFRFLNCSTSLPLRTPAQLELRSVNGS